MNDISIKLAAEKTFASYMLHGVVTIVMAGIDIRHTFRVRYALLFNISDSFCTCLLLQLYMEENR